MAADKVKMIVSSNPAAVFSKTSCPYCTRVKQLLRSLGAKFYLMELDMEEDGDSVQSAIMSLYRHRTVPAVFIGGNLIGGCDATYALHNQGKLVPLLQEAGAK